MLCQLFGAVCTVSLSKGGRKALEKALGSVPCPSAGRSPRSFKSSGCLLRWSIAWPRCFARLAIHFAVALASMSGSPAGVCHALALPPPPDTVVVMARGRAFNGRNIPFSGLQFALCVGSSWTQLTLRAPYVKIGIWDPGPLKDEVKQVDSPRP